jgi:signal transduction histidine kinase
MNQKFHSNRLFRGVPEDFMVRIGPAIREVTYEAGETIFSEEEVGNTFYLVEEGLVRISKLGRGQAQETITFIERQDFFGEMALLDSSPRSARATAVEKVVLGSIDREAFQQLLGLGCPEIYMNFLLQIVERLRGVTQHFISEVMRSERLSLVGSMAAAIIHDLNNPISVIRACNEMLELQDSASDRAKLVLLNKTALDRILAMIQELLDFSRGHIVEIKAQPETVHRILDDLDAQVLRLLPKQNIELVRDIDYHGEVAVDRGRFVRMLANVIKNAMESMPKGGLLTLAVFREDDAVVFSITDTGGGIPPEIQARIFEPFVTVGKKQGTGLGMAIAKSVVEAHEGKISVHSEVGVGTRVEIRIPAATRAGAGDSTEPQQARTE